jgi:hypothetical protein
MVTTVLLAASIVAGQVENVGVPAKVQKSMEYYVGYWEAEWEEDGETHKSMMNVRWAQGKHCTIINYRERGPEGISRSTIISGWHPGEEAVVDTIHDADGAYRQDLWTIVSETVEEATSTGVTKDGKRVKGKVRIEKMGRDKFIWKGYDRYEGDKALPDVVIENVRKEQPKPKGKKKQ